MPSESHACSMALIMAVLTEEEKNSKTTVERDGASEKVTAEPTDNVQRISEELGQT